MIEILVVMSIFGIIAAIAAPQFRASRVRINNAHRMVLANLRLARANAISRSVHYQVSFPTATQIRVSRMQETPPGSGTWVVDTTNAQTIPMPTATEVASTVVGNSYEFNSRGITVNLTGPQRIDVTDTYGVTKSVQVWPSGQVNEL
jgi:Tfp pilus assembly protein FimT